MKIAILSFYNDLIDRGVETWAKDVKEKLSKDYDIEIIGGKVFGNKINWKSKNFFYWKFLLITHCLKNLSSWSRADIVIPTNGTVQTVICRFITWLRSKPMVVFGHAGLGADDKFNLLCSPDVFIAFSQYQKEWAEKNKLPWTKIVKINHAVDLTRFKVQKTKPHKDVVLSVGSNTQDKRIYLVELAMENIKGAEFVAVGKGHPLEMSFEQMHTVYAHAKVFCLVPQTWEAFGLVFLEALASNLPVVSIDDPIRREIVGEAGILVKNPEDIKSLTNAIQNALTTDWKDIPRKQAEKFGWANMSKQYINLFESLRK